MQNTRFENCLWAAISISIALLSVNAAAQSRKPIDVDKARVVEFWTKERRAAAIPRDLVIDPRGLGYLRRPDGTLVPYGHRVEAEQPRRTPTPSPFAKPSGGGGKPGGGDTQKVSNAEWTTGGDVQKASGRLLFAMGVGNYYVCSGTVVTDDKTGRSIIMTAAHCVFDEETTHAFASNVLFIPDQAHTTGVETDFDCSNDKVGCWVPSFGVVDVNWTNYIFPDNIAWDYGYYVVNDAGAHTTATYSRGDASFPSGNDQVDALDGPQWAGSLPLSFSDPKHDVRKSSSDFTYALGYSYSYDPKFMYCAEDMTTNGSVNWWLARCGLSGGSSGGPWVQPMDTTSGTGPIISVNSWGYTTGPGMAGPKLFGTSAECVFGVAKNTPIDGGAGVAVTCP